MGANVIKIPGDEIGRNVIVGRCNNCGGDEFNIMWEEFAPGRLRLKRLHCTECRKDIDIQKLMVSPKPL